MLPWLTEFVYELGLGSNLVGRSHECDLPECVSELPAVTLSKITNSQTSDGEEIHGSVTNLLRHSLSLYEVNEQLLVDLQPDVILTQDHCEVCAVSYSDLSDAVKKRLGSNVEIVSVSPSNLDDIFAAFATVSKALGEPEKGTGLIQKIKERFDDIQTKARALKTPRVIAIEWMSPLMTGGNWMPEMIEIAGGKSLLASPGEHSPWVEWETIVAADPEILLILPCGYDIPKTQSEIKSLTGRPGWESLRAVKNGNVFILDGNKYFNRPGPGVLNSVEILAEIFHPDQFRGMSPYGGWQKLESES